MRPAAYQTVTSNPMFAVGVETYARASFVSCKPNHSEVHFAILLDSARQHYLRHKIRSLLVHFNSEGFAVFLLTQGVT